MKRRPNRVRRVMKWVGLVGCIIVAVLWILSAFGYVSIIRNGVQIGLNTGAMHYAWGVTDGNNRLANAYYFVWPRRPYLQWTPHTYPAHGVTIPLWVPFFILAVPTYFLWRRDRCKPEGCCKECGYDLTGNESGTCPECGTEIN